MLKIFTSLNCFCFIVITWYCFYFIFYLLWKRIVLFFIAPPAFMSRNIGHVCNCLCLACVFISMNCYFTPLLILWWNFLLQLTFGSSFNTRYYYFYFWGVGMWTSVQMFTYARAVEYPWLGVTCQYELPNGEAGNCIWILYKNPLLISVLSIWPFVLYLL